MSGVEGFFLSAGANTVGTMMTDYLVKPVERRLRYLFGFHKIVQELHHQEEILTTEQTQLHQRVEDARGLTSMWTNIRFKDAENVFQDVLGLGSRIEENKRCFRLCPHWTWRYRLSKEIERKTLDITRLVELSKSIGQVGRRAPLPCIDLVPSKDFVVSKSSTTAFNEIMDALKDDKVNMIGVWGMGGVGKTTLVTEVGSKAKELQLFHRVIKVVGSQTLDIGKIQEKISDFLDFKFEKRSKEGKGEELWSRLEEERKVLVILDDMWNELNLKEIGIPFAAGNDRSSCKIILTTRRKQVCESMESQVTVAVGVFDEEEAWTLFTLKANLDNAPPDIIKWLRKLQKNAKACLLLLFL